MAKDRGTMELDGKGEGNYVIGWEGRGNYGIGWEGRGELWNWMTKERGSCCCVRALTYYGTGSQGRGEVVVVLCCLLPNVPGTRMDISETNLFRQ